MTLSTSDKKNPDLEKWRKGYLYLSVVCLIFSMIYECFSHNVFSPFMVFAVAFPLLGGSLVAELLGKLPADKFPDGLAGEFYHWGIITLMVGSIIRGVMDIYGTESPLVVYYAVAGIGLVVVAVCMWILSFFKKNEETGQF